LKHGVEIVPFGELADPRLVAELAEEAEHAGWEAISVWDHVGFPYGVGDPWVMLAAAAARTERLALIVGVAAIPRYKPHLLARTLASLDHLSGGRMILGAGLGGVAEEFSSYGEDSGAAVRAAKLDEALELLTRFFSGEPVTYEGRYYSVRDAVLCPAPLQRPRIPIWIGGESRRALRRAARWDGWIVPTIDETGATIRRPETIARSVDAIRESREVEAGSEVAVSGITRPGEGALVRQYESAGATWWLESLFGLRGPIETLRRRVRDGPPV
jgi:alkanesulfonate monooxygenase SsuD/methylene tetrahydromethanopterin reductase-like flavin-dependent oxidoreductase (luciferase family)